jgi:hypothetical protein
VVSDEYNQIDTRVTIATQLLALLRVRGQRRQRDFRPVLEKTVVSVNELRALIGAILRERHGTADETPIVPTITVVSFLRRESRVG